MKLAQQSNCIMRTLILLFSSTKERISILINHRIHLNQGHKVKTSCITNEISNPIKQSRNTSMDVSVNDLQRSDVSNQSNQSHPPIVNSQDSDNEINSVCSENSITTIVEFYECNYSDCHHFGHQGYPCSRCAHDSGSYYVGKKLDDKEMDRKVELMRQQDEEAGDDNSDSDSDVSIVDSKDREIPFAFSNHCRYCDGHPCGRLGEPCRRCHIGSHLI